MLDAESKNHRGWRDHWRTSSPTPAKALSLQQVIQVDIQMSFEEFWFWQTKIWFKTCVPNIVLPYIQCLKVCKLMLMKHCYLHYTAGSPICTTLQKVKENGGIFQCSRGIINGTFCSSSVLWLCTADFTKEMWIQSLTVLQKITNKNKESHTKKMWGFEVDSSSVM